MTAPDTAAVDRTESAVEPVEFMGRQLMMRYPNPEQVVILRGMQTSLEAVGEQWNGFVARRDAYRSAHPGADLPPELLNEGAELAGRVLRPAVRFMAVLEGIMVDPDQNDWLMHEIAARRLHFGDVSELVTNTITTFLGSTNRETRRASGRAARAKRV